MRYYPLALLGFLVVGGALAQSAATQPAGDDAQTETGGDQQNIDEQRTTLLRELQQLREALEQSEARMRASQERIRTLQSEKSQPAQGEP